MTSFFTRREAASAIAAQIHPSDAAKQADVADLYFNRLYDALCAGELIGRYAERWPIPLERPGSVFAFHDCLIRDTDLNEWLDKLGIGVQVSGASLAPEGELSEAVPGGEAETGDPALTKPTSTQLADALGPFLQGGQDSGSLKAMLHDVRGRPRLAKFRKMKSVGRREFALWEVGGVVLYLIEEQYLLIPSAREALEKHYPEHLHAIDHIPMPSESTPAANWIPAGI